jgi:hypothetical protein
MRRCHLKKPLVTSYSFKVIKNSKQISSVFPRKSFYFIGVFPDFLDTLYVLFIQISSSKNVSLKFCSL